MNLTVDQIGQRFRLLEEENALLRNTIKQYQTVVAVWAPDDRPPDYVDHVSHVATNGTNTLLQPSLGESMISANEYHISHQGNYDAASTQTKIFIDKIEQLARENERALHRMEDHMGIIKRLQSEKEELVRRCAALEAKVNVLQQVGDSVNEQGSLPWEQILEPLHWLTDEQYTLLHLPCIDTAIDKQKIEENMLHSVVPLEDENQQMECFYGDIPDRKRPKQELLKDATTQTKYYQQSLVKLRDCRMCLQTFNESQLEGKLCYYHPSRPLNFEEWRVILPKEANDPLNRKLKLYTCCDTMSAKRPPGCVGPRSHEPT